MNSQDYPIGGMVEPYDVEVEKRLAEQSGDPNCNLCHGTGFFYMNSCRCVGNNIKVVTHRCIGCGDDSRHECGQCLVCGAAIVTLAEYYAGAGQQMAIS